ncbi:MAG: deoxynucleoside kinase [Anaerolineae bacterium]|nr:deoxynucleoside kinase [Anaerolineae bacterium]
MPTNFYIAIEGVIGVGKTTLARLIGQQIGAELLLEVFEENPFLSSFYADRDLYAFQTQIFFLLSRYRQQHNVIRQTLARSPLISDYTFAKDRLFAELNLENDELAMYHRVHEILAEKITPPDLLIYLRAGTDTLMKRIAVRDRVYERGMSREYIEELRVAYEAFFADYVDTPVLVIDTDDLDYVRRANDLAYVVGRVRSALTEGDYQPSLPQLDMDLDTAEVLRVAETRRRLPDFQRWHQALDVEKGFLTDLYFNYIALTEEVGELGRAFKNAWRTQDALMAQVGNRQEAQDRALSEHLPAIQEELADLLAYVLKLSNYVGIDLEETYLNKMRQNKGRTWRPKEGAE